MAKKRQWNSSAEILDEVHELFDDLRANAIPCEDARVLQKLVQQGVKIVELEVSAAKVTGRLKEGSATIPGFKRGS